MTVIGLATGADSSCASQDWREQIRHLLDQLDRQKSKPVQESRRAARQDFRSPRVLVHVLNSRGEPTTRLTVPTRNISANGLAFLHKQMLTIGVQLQIEIPVLDQRQIVILARVARCRHVKGMVHEVGVEFLDAPEIIETAVNQARSTSGAK